jgi:lysophospholipase L1-like esterase
MIGTNDVATYSPGTWLASYTSLLNQIQAAEPGIRIVGNTVIPQLGNPANIPLMNADILSAWNTYDGANPTVPILRCDSNTAIGGPTYNVAYYGDNLHPNDAGHALLASAMLAASSSVINTLTTY